MTTFSNGIFPCNTRPLSTPSGCAAQWPDSLSARALLAYRGLTVRAAGAIANILTTTPPVLPFLPHTDALLSLWLEGQQWPARRLRIGIIAPGAWGKGGCDGLTQPCGWLAPEWINIPSPGHAPGGCDDHNLDASIENTPNGSIAIYSRETAEKPAVWDDWGAEQPLSYASVFPLRLDCGSLTLPMVDDTDAEIIRHLLLAMAVFSRHPARLSLADQTVGRLSCLGASRWPDTVCTLRPRSDWSRNAVLALAHALARSVYADSLCAPTSAATPSPAKLAAARLIGAWAASSAYEISDADRLAAAEIAAAAAPNDAVTALRLATMQLATLDDAGGLRTLMRANGLLGELQVACNLDHTAFVHAELSHGTPSSLTTARLAAGLCIAKATTSTEHVRYLHEDLLEEIRYSALLIGRDQDRTLLEEVFRTLVRGQATQLILVPEAAATAGETVGGANLVIENTALSTARATAAKAALMAKAASKARRKVKKVA